MVVTTGGSSTISPRIMIMMAHMLLLLVRRTHRSLRDLLSVSTVIVLEQVQVAISLSPSRGACQRQCRRPLALALKRNEALSPPLRPHWQRHSLAHRLQPSHLLHQRQVPCSHHPAAPL